MQHESAQNSSTVEVADIEVVHVDQKPSGKARYIIERPAWHDLQGTVERGASPDALGVSLMASGSE